MINGPCIVLEIRQENVVKAFYKISGDCIGIKLTEYELAYHNKVLIAHIESSNEKTKRSIIAETLSPMKRIFQIDKDKSKAVGKWFRKQIQEINQKADTIKNIIEIQETSEIATPDYEFEASTELRYCPAAIDVNDHKREGHRRVLYVIPWCSTNTSYQSEVENLSPRLRPYTEISKNLTMAPIPKLHKNKKFTTIEKKRRHVVESYKHSLSLLSTSPTSSSSSKMISFLNNLSDFDRSFLGNQINVAHRESNKAGLETYEGTVAVAQDIRPVPSGWSPWSPS
jgi:hypothetical protein